MQVYKDGHHILHERREWTNRKEAMLLRETPSLVPRISRELHEDIHRNCPPVPLLGYYALLRTQKAFIPVAGNTLASMENLMRSIEFAAEHEKAHPIERELALLAVHAIDLQRPFLRREV